MLEIRSLKLFTREISQQFNLSHKHWRMRYQFAVLSNEKEKQVKVLSTMVTACTNQSEHTRFSELMENFSACYRSVKCVLICFFCFHLLGHVLKHVHQSCHLCRINPEIQVLLTDEIYIERTYFQLALKKLPSNEWRKVHQSKLEGRWES